MPKHGSKRPKTSQHIPESLVLVASSFGVTRDHYGSGQAVVGSGASKPTFEEQIGFVFWFVLQKRGGPPCSKQSEFSLEQAGKVVTIGSKFEVHIFTFCCSFWISISDPWAYYAPRPRSLTAPSGQGTADHGEPVQNHATHGQTPRRVSCLRGIGLSDSCNRR